MKKLLASFALLFALGLGAAEAQPFNIICPQMPAMTGDATSSAGTCAVSVGKILGVTITGVPASGALVGTTDAQTLTNKSLTSPTITGTGSYTGNTVTANTSVTTPIVTTASGSLLLTAAAGSNDVNIQPASGIARIRSNTGASPTILRLEQENAADGWKWTVNGSTGGNLDLTRITSGTDYLYARWISGTPANNFIFTAGTNPTIGTSAGNLAVAPAGGTMAVTGKITASASGSSFAGDISITGMTQTSVAQSGTVCYNSGTGAITYDATVGCLTSSGRFKDVLSTVRPKDALATVMALRTVSFRYKPGVTPDTAEQFGFIAEEVAAIDPRMVGFGPDGLPRGVRYQEAVAVLAAAIQAQQAEIEAIRRSP